MPDIVIDFSKGNKKIALVVRGKKGPNDHPGVMDQHADAILPDGAPIGFYGTANGSWANDVGMDMDGAVWTYWDLRRHRPWYVDERSAISHRVVSTVLIVDVTKSEADKFSAAWTRMVRRPGDFEILGNNCSTHASAAFMAAGIVSDSIPGLDTPDHLYEQLVDALPAGRRHSYTGFIGFAPRTGGGYNLTMRPYSPSPTVAAPNPGGSST